MAALAACVVVAASALLALACSPVAGQVERLEIAPISVDDTNAAEALAGLAAALEIVNGNVLEIELPDDPTGFAAPGEGAVVMLRTWPEHGSVTMSALDGSEFTYSPEAGYVGTDLFSYDTTFADGSVYTTMVNIVVPPAEQDG